MSLLVWVPIYMFYHFHITEATISIMILALSIGIMFGYLLKIYIHYNKKIYLGLLCNTFVITDFNILLVLTAYIDILFEYQLIVI